VNTKLESCNCPFCAMPRILSLAIEKGVFSDPNPEQIPTPKSARRISMATAGRQSLCRSSPDVPVHLFLTRNRESRNPR
jgi:hypothetical protein